MTIHLQENIYSDIHVSGTNLVYMFVYTCMHVCMLTYIPLKKTAFLYLLFNISIPSYAGILPLVIPLFVIEFITTHVKVWCTLNHVPVSNSVTQIKMV